MKKFSVAALCVALVFFAGVTSLVFGKSNSSIKEGIPVQTAAPNGKKTVDLSHMYTRKAPTARGAMVVPVKISDFYATNLGLPHVDGGIPMPRQVSVSFDTNMIAFWQKKTDRQNARSSTIERVPEILKRYMDTPRGFTTLPAFIKATHGVVEKAKRSLDWEKLCADYKLPSQKCLTVREVLDLLHGKDFVAYGITELLPHNARLNIPYINMLLEEAGTSYLMHFPALHDDSLSLGFYQFTSSAVRKDGTVTEGASRVNGFVKPGGMKIPDSVKDLVGDDHHVAAVYFAVHNLAVLMRQLPEKPMLAFAHKHTHLQDQMVMFIAAAHHLPAPARSGAVRWIVAGMKKPLESYYTNGTREYAIKTHDNLVALYEKYPTKKK